MPPTLNVRGFNHLLGECGMTFLASARLSRKYGGDFPRSLDGAPLLLPGEDAAVRLKLMRWFEMLRIRPRVMGEFDDGALLKAFGGRVSESSPCPRSSPRKRRKSLTWSPSATRSRLIHSCRIF